jgi:hypothetical protein
MTEQDRINRDLHESEPYRRIGPMTL